MTSGPCERRAALQTSPNCNPSAIASSSMSKTSGSASNDFIRRLLETFSLVTFPDFTGALSMFVLQKQAVTLGFGPRFHKAATFVWGKAYPRRPKLSKVVADTHRLGFGFGLARKAGAHSLPAIRVVYTVPQFPPKLESSDANFRCCHLLPFLDRFILARCPSNLRE